MRKVWRRTASLSLVLALLLGLMSGLTAQAAGTGAEVTNLSMKTDHGYSNVDLVIQDADGKSLTASAEKYTGVEKFKLTFDGTAGKQYNVFLLNGDTSYPAAPNTSGTNIRYTDQLAGKEVEDPGFTVYPDALPTGMYALCVSSTDSSIKQIATFDVKSAVPEVINMTGDKNPAEYRFSGNIMNVTHTKACVVLVAHADGSYARLTAVENQTEGYDFDVSSVNDGEKIIIAMKGDVDRSGSVNTNDITAVRKSLLSASNKFYTELDSLEVILADVNLSGKVNTTDVTDMRKALLATTNKFYAALEW